MADGEEKVGILTQLWRLFTLWKVRKALGLARVANKQFTGSVDGIRDAYDLEQIKMVDEYKELETAVGDFVSTQQQRKDRLVALNKEEAEQIQMREGAMKKIEEARKASDTAAEVKHKENFDRFHKRILAIEADQATVAEDIKTNDAKQAEFMRRLTQWQARIKQLPQEKAEQMSKFMMAKKTIELNRRLQGMSSLTEGSALSMVIEENNKLTAQAKVSSEIAGTNVEAVDEEYKSAGLSENANDALEKMLANRAATREAKAAPAKTQERPQI